MKTAFVILLVLHGGLHFFGFAKAFGLARIARLHEPISRKLGVVWLFAGLAFLATAILLVTRPELWWVTATPAIVASTVAIATSWSETALASIVNLVILVPLVLTLLDLRATSFRSVYRHEVDRRLARSANAAPVTEAELAGLPPLLQTYLRRAGVVGRPRVHDVRARWRGEMKSKPTAEWMPITAEQHDFFDLPSRVFLTKGSLYGLPFEGLHTYSGHSARMRIRIAGVIQTVDASGIEMTRSETVTLFNDMCLLAPASLIDASASWQTIDAHTVRGTFTNAGNTISALLSFDADGNLAGFVSHDRDQTADGKTYRNLPWSTPIRAYADFGGVRLPSRAEAVWLAPEGDLLYARFELVAIDFNVGPRAAPSPMALSRLEGRRERDEALTAR